MGIGPGTLVSEVGRIGAPLSNRGALVAQLDHVLLRGDAAAGHLLPTAGNRFELLEGTDAFLGRMLDDFRGATDQINFTTYGLDPLVKDGRVQRVITELRNAAARDVKVTGIVDQVGGGTLLPNSATRGRRLVYSQLREAGVDIREKPVSFTRAGLNDKRFAVDHRKLYEIDGRISYQGGINLVDSWMPWHDMMIRTEGPAAAQGGALIAARWQEVGGTVSQARRDILAAGLRAPVDDARHMAWQLSNGNRARRELTEAFVEDARTAQHRLWITNPYLADENVMQEVVKAAERGVDVRLTLSPKAGGSEQSQDWFTDPLRRAWASRIAEAGGTVHVLPEFSHAKAWIKDDIANVGSFNLDRGSTIRNYENSIRTTDPHALLSLEQLFRGQHARAMQATTDTVAGWRSVERFQRLTGFQY
ncbi:MAG: phosphatidylserine/phosphatidylglycerophosphate/cardiolipin synthase [Thermoleophilia bacterium]|nr:phosphatidylserine/phosphatidylglycerophosphate/cardiolipin synthase [Thermoleophilia bacterium]